MTEEIAKYKAFVKQLSDSNDDRVFLNSSPEHAVVVTAQIFRQSTHIVRIFAKNLCRTIGNDPEYIAALSDFIERGGEVRILLNGYEEECARVSNLYKRLAYYKHLGRAITVKTTTVFPYLTDDEDQKEIHFTIGDDKAYRIETNIESRTAECCMNGPEVSNMTVEFYDKMFNDENAVEVDILRMFGYAG